MCIRDRYSPASDFFLVFNSNEVLIPKELKSWNINFKINEGQIFGMLGPNGVGKSTIFNIIIGLIKPNYGEVYIDNKIVNNTTPSRAAS